MEPVLPRKCALFVDFDNMYLGLRDDSAEAAEVFATEPGRWLRWLEEGMEGAETVGCDGHRRAVLVRRCYLNPITFGRYRADFTRAGFSVIDCPPLTIRAKNSADIVMVMDILDSLDHKTRFDEFIVMSGDADFTPVFSRLRAYDRRTTVLVATPIAAAFRSTCDLLIPEELFVERALGVTEERSDAPLDRRDMEEVLRLMAARLADAATAAGPIPADRLPRYYAEFPEFRADRNWLGRYSLKALTEAVVAQQPELEIVGEESSWAVGIHGQPIAAAPWVAASAAAGSPAPTVGTEPAEILPWGAESQTPEAGDRLRGLSAPLAEFIRRVSRLTDVPKLTPAQYRRLFECIAVELDRNAYHVVATSKAVRDACTRAGDAVPRSAVNWVLKGIAFGGYQLNDANRPHAPGAMAEAFHKNVRTLLEQARAELTTDEERMLGEWLTGGEPEGG